MRLGISSQIGKKEKSTYATGKDCINIKRSIPTHVNREIFSQYVANSYSSNNGFIDISGVQHEPSGRPDHSVDCLHDPSTSATRSLTRR